MHSDVDPPTHDNMSVEEDHATKKSQDLTEKDKKIERLSVELDFMHKENDRMKLEHVEQTTNMKNEYDGIVLKKEKDLSSTLHKLESMQQEYTLNLQHMQGKLDEALKFIAKKDDELQKVKASIKDETELDKLNKHLQEQLESVRIQRDDKI